MNRHRSIHLMSLEGIELDDIYISIALIVLYGSAVLGALFKFRKNGVRARNLWFAIFIPLILVIQPIVTLLVIYVPGFNKDIHPVISKIRKLTGRKFNLPFMAVFSTIQLFPLYTSLLARTIAETQEDSSFHMASAWNRTTVEFLPYFLMKKEGSYISVHKQGI